MESSSMIELRGHRNRQAGRRQVAMTRMLMRKSKVDRGQRRAIHLGKDTSLTNNKFEEV